MNQQSVSPLTRITIELVFPIKLSTKFLSLICASCSYSFQYEAEASPYLLVGASFQVESEI